MGIFARVALASYLLGRVLHYVSDPFAPNFFSQQEARQLSHTLLALIKLGDADVDVEVELAWPQAAICCRYLFAEVISYLVNIVSSLLILHTWIVSLEPGTSIDTSRRNYADHILEVMAQNVVVASQALLQNPDSLLNVVSPFILHCTYQAGISLISKSRTEEGRNFVKDLDVIKEMIQRLNKRWKAAGTVNLLHKHLQLHKR